MRVLVFERWFAGHHFQYLHHLVPALARQAAEVVLVLSREGRDSEQFGMYLASLPGNVKVEVGASVASFPLSGRVERQLAGELVVAIRRHGPDHVFVPSADLETRTLGLVWRRRLPTQPGSAAALHFGAYSAVTRTAARLRQALTRLAWERSPWERLLFVNALVAEQLRARGGRLGARAEVLPHPVAPVEPQDKRECRRRCGLPARGRYLGLQGIIDSRKAVHELVDAFARASPRRDDRLVIAGWFAPGVAARIRAAHAALIAAGRLLLIDRYLTEAEVDGTLGAMDVVCTPYTGGSDALSAALLRAVAVGRPVVCGTGGWSEAMVRRFSLGWATDIDDPAAFARTLATALDEAGAFVHSEAAASLLRFHHPDNFVRCWLRSLPHRAQRDPEGEWSRVMESSR